MRYCLLSFIGIFLVSLVHGQQNFRQLQVPLSGTVVLRDVPDKYNAQVVSFEAPEPDGDAQEDERTALKEEVARRFPRSNSNPGHAGIHKSTSLQLPIVTMGFESDTFSGIPPDNYMAINRQNQAVNVMNSNIAVLNSTTGQMNFRKSLTYFTVLTGLPNSPANDRYDPKVVYDPEADKFICVILSGVNSDNWIILGFSQTNDPTGAWNFYKMYGDYAADTTWFDYPAITQTHNDFFVTGNKLIYNGTFQAGFRKSVIYQIRKSNGYNAQTLTTKLWDQVSYGGRPIRNIFPVSTGGSIKGPGQYFLSVRNMDVQNDSVFLIHVPDSAGSGNNNMTIVPLVSNINYGFPPDGREPDTSLRLQTNDGRVLGAFMEGNEIQFATTTVHPVNGNAAIYHGRISNVGSSPAVLATYITVDTLDFGYPNLSYAGTVNGKVTSIISFDYTGLHTYPGFGAVMYDGTSYSDLLRIKTGDSTIHMQLGSGQRWGDYSGSQVAWDVPGSVWVVGIFGRPDHIYGNWMARLKSPIYTGVTTPVKPVSNAALYPNPAWQFVKIAFELKQSGTMHFEIYNSTGQLVDKLVDAACYEGKNELRFNVEPLAAGDYFIKATDDKGEMVFTKKFLRQ